MQFQSELPLVSLTWQKVAQTPETEIRRMVRINPEPSLEKLISDLDSSQVTTVLAEKAFKAISYISIPGDLFERLSSALLQKGIFTQQQAAQFKAHQSLSRFLTEAEPSCPLNSLEDALKDPQNTLNTLCKSPAPWNIYTLNAICSLIETNILPPHSALEKLVKVQNYRPCLTQAALALIRGIENFPDPLLLNPEFFFFLCQNVSKDDTSLYPLIRQVITKRDDCDIEDENRKIPFDYFLENGGNLAALFQGLDSELLSQRSYPYMETQEEFYPTLGSAEMMFILHNTEVRAEFLKAENLEFLKDSLIVALAQFCDLTLTENSPYCNHMLRVLKKLTLLQQEKFLYSLSEEARQKLQKVFVSRRRDFKNYKYFLHIHAKNLIESAERLGLLPDHIECLNQLLAAVASNPTSSTSEKAKNTKQYFEYTEGEQRAIIIKLEAINRRLSIWTGDHRYQMALPCISFISNRQMQFPTDPELKAIAEQKAKTQLKVLANDLSNKVLDNLKYQIALKKTQTLLNPNKSSLEEVDWTELVSKLFGEVSINSGSCPSQKGDEQDVWKSSVTEQLETAVQSSFILFKIKTLKNLIDWIENKRSFDEMEKTSLQGESDQQPDKNAPPAKKIKRPNSIEY